MGSNRNANGRFVRGNSAAAGNRGARPKKGSDIPCPERLAPVRGAWNALKSAADKGNIRAAMDLIGLAKEFGVLVPEGATGEEAALYTGLPESVAVMLMRLDCGISATIRRHELGLPMSIEEVKIAECAKTLQSLSQKQRFMARSQERIAMVHDFHGDDISAAEARKRNAKLPKSR